MDFTAYIGIAFNYLDYLKLKVAPDDNEPYFDVSKHTHVYTRFYVHFSLAYKAKKQDLKLRNIF